MAKLNDKIENGLNEARTLVLGAQVLLGFQYLSVFREGFEKLPRFAQYLKVGALGLMLIALALLLSPAAYHRIVKEGEDGEDFHRFITRVIGPALLPFAAGFSIDFYIAVEKEAGQVAGILAGLATLAMALFFWYGLEALHKTKREPVIKREQSMTDEKEPSQEGGTPLSNKIKQVMTELRVVLPGVQALLGFQFSAMLTEGFDKLPASSRFVHLSSLAAVALSAILLMTPAAYHRLVEEGENTEHFDHFAGNMLLASMVPLALGVTGDFYVVVRKVTESMPLAVSAAVAMLILFFGLWFGYTLYLKKQRERAQGWALQYDHPRTAA
ncbi:MAG: DUF6328 family protein [Armatimonadota bacterium]|nr:DUF6328 family protein [Armatimonadota bacterium]